MKKINQINKQTNLKKGLTMKRNLFALLAAVFIVVLLVPVSLQAQLTPAGTVIKTVATATYKDIGGTDMPGVVSDTAYTTVDQMPGIDLTPTSYYKIVGDSVNVDYAFVLTNTGNGTDSYDLTTLWQHNGSSGWSLAFYLDADKDGVPDNTGSPITSITNLPMSRDTGFVMRVFVPLGTANGTIDTVQLKAESQYAIANPAYGSAVAYSRDTLEVRKVEWVKSKEATGTTKPGDVVEYEIKFVNTGSSTAKNVTIRDILPNNLTFKTGGYAGPADFQVDSAGVGGGSPVAGSTVTWNPGDVLPGKGVGFRFKVTINSGVYAGTIIQNYVSISYIDSVSTNKPGRKDSTGKSITVSELLGWMLKVDLLGGSFPTNDQDDSVDVSTAQWFGLKLYNRGNRLDTAQIFKTTSLPLTWTIYKDLNKNMAFDGGDVVWTAYDTISVAKDDSVWFLVTATPANSIQDRKIDTAYYSFKSKSNLTAPDSTYGYTYTLVKSPKLMLNKTVAKGANGLSRPGDTLTYTIRYWNSGSGNANTVVLSDVMPEQVTFLTGSVELSPDGTSWTPQAVGSGGVSWSSPTLQYNANTVYGWGNATTPKEGWIRFKSIIK